MKFPFACTAHFFILHIFLNQMTDKSSSEHVAFRWVNNCISDESNYVQSFIQHNRLHAVDTAKSPMH